MTTDNEDFSKEYAMFLDDDTDFKTTYHVYPIAEETKHQLTGLECRCEPILDFTEGGSIVVIHNREQ